MPGDTLHARNFYGLRARFQSAPGVNAGRYTGPGAYLSASISFNPLPALMPGDTKAAPKTLPLWASFNPLPALMPGDTFAVRLD